ncbi:hypothetical protein TNCV_1115741 [Trichonephila clavipes]|nr:hypothetical protein TNCV_1115741 [Trichonephila clavipes]
MKPFDLDNCTTDRICRDMVPDVAERSMYLTTPAKSYRRDLPNALYHQDSLRSHVARRVLTFVDAQSIRLLHWPA